MPMRLLFVAKLGWWRVVSDSYQPSCVHFGSSSKYAATTGQLCVLQEVGEDSQAPPEWLGEIEPIFLSYEAVPLLNFPFFNEVLLMSRL